MNGGRIVRSGGYTIIETLIFLAVSGAMFISAMALISGRQAKADFNSAVRDFDSQLQDIANDVSDGYYSNLLSNGRELKCSATSSNLLLGAEATTGTQGSHNECIFMGKAIQFEPQGKTGSYNLMLLVGKRLNDDNEDVTDYNEAVITAVAPPYGVDATTNFKLRGGAEVTCVMYSDVPSETLGAPGVDPCSVGNETDNVAFISALRASPTSSGGSQVDIVLPPGTTNNGRSEQAVANAIKGYRIHEPVMNPSQGVLICITSGGTNQHAIVRLAGKNGRFSTTTTIEDGVCK
jgi:hypothetical protein